MFKRVVVLEKELDMYVERAKDVKKRIDAYKSEIRNVIVNPEQLSLVPLAAAIEAGATEV